MEAVRRPPHGSDQELNGRRFLRELTVRDEKVTEVELEASPGTPS